MNLGFFSGFERIHVGTNLYSTSVLQIQGGLLNYGAPVIPVPRFSLETLLCGRAIDPRHGVWQG
jgi:hypothetical protein